VRSIVKRLLAVEPFLTLGKASLEVFCAHLVFCFVGLALLYRDTPQLHGWRAAGLLVFTFASLIWLAARVIRKRQEKKRQTTAI
jgi:threonine/homoserine/homoserine lactone efflux protein